MKPGSQYLDTVGYAKVSSQSITYASYPKRLCFGILKGRKPMRNWLIHIHLVNVFSLACEFLCPLLTGEGGAFSNDAIHEPLDQKSAFSWQNRTCVSAGTVQQEWSRLQEFVNSVQVDCRHSSNAIFTLTDTRTVDDVLYLSCPDNRRSTEPSSCRTALFRCVCTMVHVWLMAWHSGRAVLRMYEVTLCLAWLVQCWVTVFEWVYHHSMYLSS